MKTKLLTASDISSIMRMKDVLIAVETAFRDYGSGVAQMPPKLYLTLSQFNGDFRAMPAYVEGSAGVKWVSVYPDNPKIGLPTVMATIVYSDPQTGFPLAIMDATELTNYRTGAAGGVAAKYLARPDSRTLGLIGAGAQARTQLLAVTTFFSFTKVKIWSPVGEQIDDLAAEFPELPIERASIDEAAACDIVSTTTPVRAFIIERGWVGAGAHINAIGADAPGKQELDPQILKDAKVVVDDVAQARHSGEINIALSGGLFLESDIYATLGEIVVGAKKGREADEITVFDSTGLAIQDIATARMLFEVAKREGIGYDFDMPG
ncbi:MAG: ornithine cyclodeaminase family protein [Actinobacteria bacterium]|nr:ornithine cyclodeaminase family protein [Actinomycetota bacterium]